MRKLTKRTNERKITCFAMALTVAIISLFVSCDGGKITQSISDGVAYVSFEERVTRDGVTIDYKTEDYDNLFWFYTAEKADDYGTTGETDGKTPYKKESDNTPLTGLDLDGKTKGPFSEGNWKFTLYAYKCQGKEENGVVTYTYDENNRTLIYKSKEITVTLLAGETKLIPITVNDVEGEGKLILNNLYFDSSKDIATAEMVLTRQDDTSEESGSSTSTTEKLSLSSTEQTETSTQTYSISFSESATSTTLTSGTYKCVVNAYKTENTTPSFTSTFYFALYAGMETTLGGELKGEE